MPAVTMSMTMEVVAAAAVVVAAAGVEEDRGRRGTTVRKGRTPLPDRNGFENTLFNV